jgi:hypothetical protein
MRCTARGGRIPVTESTGPLRRVPSPADMDAAGPGRTSGACTAARAGRTVSRNSSETPRRARSIVRRLALSLAIMATLLAVPATRGASGACSGPAHDPVLGSGTASPATGNTGTVFTFSVTYADTKGCAPLWVRVVIPGVGTFAMNSAGTTYDTGVIFTQAMALPDGAHSYSFEASSGIGSGQKTTTLASVSPPSITAIAPTPQPPPPTPLPPPPTPLPTPVPTAAATPTETPSDSGSPGSTVASPSGAAGTPSGSGASQDQGQAPGASGGPAGSPGSFSGRDGMGSFVLLLGAWATATLAGLALFLFLAPRRRAPLRPAAAEAGPAELATDSHRPPRPAAAEDVSSDLIPSDEAQLPRWLRPSVQAARHDQRGSRSGTHRLGDS